MIAGAVIMIVTMMIGFGVMFQAAFAGTKGIPGRHRANDRPGFRIAFGIFVIIAAAPASFFIPLVVMM